jgi:hypothetical protein
MNNTEFRTGVIRPVECVKEGWELIKSDYWILFAIWLVGGLIGSVSLFIASGAMTCGIFYCYLRKIDGHPVNFDDLWKGMQWFLPGLVVMILMIAPMVAVYIVIYVPIVLAGVMGGNLSQDELMGLLLGAVLIDIVLIIFMICVHTLLIFALPLIVDRNLGAVKAITTSARAVFKNLGGVVGLFLVNFVLVLIGYLALCIGIYLVIPIIIAGNIVAYRKVFPRLGDGSFAPPPPTAYSGI